ncbi:MAG: ComEC/Rec2 family competence protein [Prolixibacteraceae bacterium]
MNFSRSYPFVRLLSFQLFGIFIANFSPGLEKIFLVSLPVLLIWLAILGRKKNYPFGLVHSSALAVLIIMISFTGVHDHQHNGPEISSGLRSFEARVLSRPVEKTNSFQIVTCVLQTDSFTVKKLKLNVYLEKTNKARGIQPGDLIYARSVVNEIGNLGNPFEFDYQRYMSRKQIRYSTYIPAANYRLITVNNPPLHMSLARLQGKLVSELKKKFSSDPAFQVVSALTLGYRDELTKETQSYFISTGAMHILAVSGLHVGMIFMFLRTMLAFLCRMPAGKILNLIIMASCLWGYALLTGLSPSVQRATVMFSFILIGNSINRQASIYNSIAASAFFLLFLNPDLLFDAGFQLSYLAVVGIVFFYPRLTALLTVRNRILDFGWKLICVSVAAQLSTFPLSIFYFHQFPLYFWLSNLFVVPASSVILALTGTFFILLPVSHLSSILAQIICTLTDFTLSILKRIGELPFAVIDNQMISSGQFFCLLLALSFSMAFIAHKRHSFLFTALSFLLLFQLAGVTQKISLFDQRKLIVYQTGSGERLIHLINGRTNYLITETDAAPNPHLYQNVLLNLRLKQPTVVPLNSGKNTRIDLIVRRDMIQFSDKTLVLRRIKQDEILHEAPVSFSQGLIDLTRTEGRLIHIETGIKEKNSTKLTSK